MVRPSEYAPELRERPVGMVFEHAHGPVTSGASGMVGPSYRAKTSAIGVIRMFSVGMLSFTAPI
jgi:hypothetical protein